MAITLRQLFEVIDSSEQIDIYDKNKLIFSGNVKDIIYTSSKLLDRKICSIDLAHRYSVAMFEIRLLGESNV